MDREMASRHSSSWPRIQNDGDREDEADDDGLALVADHLPETGSALGLDASGRGEVVRHGRPPDYLSAARTRAQKPRPPATMPRKTPAMREGRLGAGGVVEHEAEKRAGDDCGSEEATEPDEVAAPKAGVPGLLGTGLWHRSNLTRRTRPRMRGSGAVVIVGGRPGRG